MNPVRRRVAQFWRYLFARITPDDYASVATVLPPPLAALFRRMAPGEQFHCLRVMRLAQAAGHTQPELLQAALLHDVGKIIAPINILERVEAVLVRWLLPAHFARWGQTAPRGWRRPLVTATQHPAWGAELAAQAGAPERVVRLIRRHQELDVLPDTPENQLLDWLQTADKHA